MTDDHPNDIDIDSSNKRIKISEEDEDKNNKKKQLWEEKCHVCQKENSKYKCPRCFKMTCSLNCSKKHKIDDKCSGKRDRTSFKPIKEFKDEDLISDLQFLRDIKQKSDQAKKKRCFEERKRRNKMRKKVEDNNNENKNDQKSEDDIKNDKEINTLSAE